MLHASRMAPLHLRQERRFRTFINQQAFDILLTEIDRERQSHRSAADDQDRVFAHANAWSSFVTSAPIAATTSTVIGLMVTNRGNVTSIHQLANRGRSRTARMAAPGSGREPSLLHVDHRKLEV